jgi:polyhydroxyalkanoate synthesis regulator phasin
MTTYADATDKTVDTFKQGARAMTDRLDFLATMPSFDFVEPVERYFDYLQKAVDLNREMLVRWAELASQMSGTLRDEAVKAGHALEDKVEELADKTGELAIKGKDIADQAVDQAGQVVDEAVEKGKETAEKATGKAKEMADDATDTAEEITDEAADTAEDLADDAAETAQKSTSRTRRR